MESKLIKVEPHEAENKLELSLRQDYTLLKPKLIPPLNYIIISSKEDYLNFNRAILYGVLCEPNLAKTHIKVLHAIVNDGYSLFVSLVVEVVDNLYPKLLETPKLQLIWVVSVMVDVSGVGFDGVFVSLLRQIVGGDFSDGNLWLSCEVVGLLLSKWDLILDEEPMVLAYGLYGYLRLLSDHYRIARNPRSEELVRREIVFCVRVLREQFDLCLRVGRDLVRLLQEVVHIPEIRVVWKDLVLHPSSFGTGGFSDVSDIYGVRTSSRFMLLRITPEMETQLRFLLTHVKFGAQRRHQAWFARKFLFVPERETIIPDIVRFICCAHHPSNDILQSDVIPRWAVIGWLLKSCTKKYFEASVKLSLLYDWLFFDGKVDNVMNIEPAMLLMVNSLPRYADMTNSILEFLLLLVENYDVDRKSVILKGVSSAMSTLVGKGVIKSLDVLTSSDFLSPFVKVMLQKFMFRVETGAIQEPQPPVTPLIDLPLPHKYDMETEAHVPAMKKPRLSTDQKSKSGLIESATSFSSSCVSSEGQVDDVANMIGKIGGTFRSSSKRGQQIVEQILLLCVSPDSQEKLGDVSSEFLAREIKKELELAGYKLFSPVGSVSNSHDADDEVQSITATLIRTFIFTQHQRIREMLLCWLRDSCFVGARMLSYALRLAYEAHEGGHGASCCGEIDYTNILPLLKYHIEGYSAFMLRNAERTSSIDEKLISKMIKDAFTSYRSIVLERSRNDFTKEVHLSPGKIMSFDIVSSSVWNCKSYSAVFHAIFSYLSDLSVGDEDLIMFIVTQLDHSDLVSMQIDLGLKRYSVFGDDVQIVLQLVKRSVHWSHEIQHKLWGLVRSELVVSQFPVEKLLVYCFFSEDIDPKVSGIAFEGLMTLCSCLAPTSEVVGAVMLLPNDKFPDFAAAVLSCWAVSNSSMLSMSIADFLDKFEKKNESASLDWNGICINQSALIFLLNYLEAPGALGNNLLDKSALNLSAIRTRLGNPVVAMNTG